MRIPFLDLSIKDPEHKAELLLAVEKVLIHGRIVHGPEVDKFEKQIAQFIGRKHAVGVASGTDAVYLALRALDIGSGDEVITTPLSWIATFNAIAACGAIPVSVDIRQDLNIDPFLIEQAITPNTKAILPVHFTGKPCEMDVILSIAKKHSLFVIEDAAQGFGAAFKGSPVGGFGNIGAFSLNPMKVLKSFGNAGVILTDDYELQERIRRLTYAGTINAEECIEIALNSKIDTIQAAMVLVNFRYFNSVLARRSEVAIRYDILLSDVVICPKRNLDYKHSYYTYTILAENRDELQNYLTSRGIETKVQHLVLMPEQPAYNYLPTKTYPVAEDLRNKILSIPAHENTTEEEQMYISECVHEFYSPK